MSLRPNPASGERHSTRLQWGMPSVGMLISCVLHGAFAAAILSQPEMLGVASNSTSVASTGTVVTVVIDSITDDERPDRSATAAVATTAMPASLSLNAATPRDSVAQSEPSLAEPTAAAELPAPTSVAEAAPLETKLEVSQPAVDTMSTQAAAAPASATTKPIERPVQAPSAAASASQGDMIRYANKVRSRLAAHRPAGNGQRGKILITFTIGPSGSIDAIDVTNESGSSRLDRVVVASIRGAAPFPMPPPNSTSQQRTFAIPFEFR